MNIPENPASHLTVTEYYRSEGFRKMHEYREGDLILAYCEYGSTFAANANTDSYWYTSIVTESREIGIDEWLLRFCITDPRFNPEKIVVEVSHLQKQIISALQVPKKYLKMTTLKERKNVDPSIVVDNSVRGNCSPYTRYQVQIKPANSFNLSIKVCTND